MSTLHFRNAALVINGVDLSATVESVNLNFSSEKLDRTAMGNTTRIGQGGLLAWSIDVNFHQDFASGLVDATLFSLVGTTACVELRPQNVCSTAINPIYSGVGLISKYNPVGGKVGTLLDAPLTIECASSLSRNTTAT